MLIEAGSRFDATTNIFSEINLNRINRLFVCLWSALASVLTACFALKANLVSKNSSSTKYQERHMQLHNLIYLLIAKLVFTFEKEFQNGSNLQLSFCHSF